MKPLNSRERDMTLRACATETVRVGRDVLVVVINLDLATDRLAHMQCQLGRAGIAWVRFPAFLGCDVPPRWRDMLDASWLLPGEIGCYASHLAVLEVIADLGVPALVLEDDVTIDVTLPDLLDELGRVLPAEWDIVRLSNKTVRATHTVATLDSGKHLVHFSHIPRGTGASLISPSGARKFLRLRQRRFAIDQDLRMAWIWGLNTYGITPPPIATEAFAHSSICTTKADREQMNRRNLYRRAFCFESLARHRFGISKIGFAPWMRLIAINAARLISKRARQSRRARKPFPPVPAGSSPLAG